VRDDEARACDVGIAHCAVGGGGGDVGAGVLLGAAPRDCILDGNSADVQVGLGRGQCGRKAGKADALAFGDREARCTGEAAVAEGALGVDDAVGGGVAVVDPADVDLGIHEHVAGKEKRERGGAVVADTVPCCCRFRCCCDLVVCLFYERLQSLCVGEIL